MNIQPGECWYIGPDGMRCIERAYPTPPEPHSAADLLRPLAADNACLRRQVAALEADVAALAEALQAMGRLQW